MAKYKDERTTGRSKLVPFIPGESSTDRHARRLQANVHNEEVILAWCEQHEMELRINNNGHHWIITSPLCFLAEWWPSSAKLVFGKQWDRGIHCHDVEQLRKELDRELSRLHNP